MDEEEGLRSRGRRSGTTAPSLSLRSEYEAPDRANIAEEVRPGVVWCTAGVMISFPGGRERLRLSRAGPRGRILQEPSNDRE